MIDALQSVGYVYAENDGNFENDGNVGNGLFDMRDAYLFFFLTKKT